MFPCQNSLGDFDALTQPPAHYNDTEDVWAGGVGDRRAAIKSNRCHSSPDSPRAYAVSHTYLFYVPYRLNGYQQYDPFIPNPLWHQPIAPLTLGMNASPGHPLTAIFDLPVDDFVTRHQFSLKGISEPLRSDDPRADFFAAYRKKADEPDSDYAREQDGYLYPDTRLRFVSESIPTRSSIVCPPPPPIL